jgi:cytochrome c556
MKKMAVVVGVLLLGAGTVMADQKLAVSQDNFMRGLAKNMYDVLGKMARGDIPYNQAAADAAIAQLEADVPKIPDTFKDNPKEDVANGHYGASQKVWQNKADFDSKVPVVVKAIASVKGTVKDQNSLKAAFKTMNDACNGCHETYRVKLK